MCLVIIIIIIIIIIITNIRSTKRPVVYAAFRIIGTRIAQTRVNHYKM